MSNWNMYHAFYRAVDHGLVEPLYCTCQDRGRLFLRADKDYEPALYCYMCLRLTHPDISHTGHIRDELAKIGQTNF